MNPENNAPEPRLSDLEKIEGQPSGSTSENDLSLPCPNCQQGHLEYDGSLNLVCGQCGYTLSGGGFT